MLCNIFPITLKKSDNQNKYHYCTPYLLLVNWNVESILLDLRNIHEARFRGRCSQRLLRRFALRCIGVGEKIILRLQLGSTSKNNVSRLVSDCQTCAMDIKFWLGTNLPQSSSDDGTTLWWYQHQSLHQDHLDKYSGAPSPRVLLC